MAPQLSIIVPVYNVEKYIHTCVESIFKQGLDDECFEVIIVNDGSTDRSMEMIQDIIIQHQNIIIINQEQQGVSVARNNGIETAQGEYIQFVDADDFLIENSLLFLLDKAITSKADIITADYIRMNDNQIAQFAKDVFKQKDGASQERTGEEFLLKDHSPYSCHI